MAVSAAAGNPLMGAFTLRFPWPAIMTVLNARLGQWIEHPNRRRVVDRVVAAALWPKYLYSEMRGRSHLDGLRINVSDGGHTRDNLGVGPLVQRRCRLILACDAEHDPNYTYESLAAVIRRIEIDFKVRITVDVAQCRPSLDTGLAAHHSVVGRIWYPDGTQGWVVILKSLRTGDEPDEIMSYLQYETEFPNRTTANQFFNARRFEAYRTLGHHIAWQAFKHEVPEQLQTGDLETEWEREVADPLSFRVKELGPH